jgi:LemA protein
MDEHIERLKSEGKISDSEARELEAALETSRAEDEALLRQFKQRRAHRRPGSIWAVLNISVLCLALAAFTYLSVVAPSRASRAASAEREAPEAFKGQNLDVVIAGLEAKLRQPGRPSDYRQLARAYTKRFQISQQHSDLLLAEQALARARSLQHKDPTEAGMAKHSAVFGILWTVIIIAGIGVTIMLPYNSLVKKDEMVDARWSQVETVLQRRLDLIPGLVESVKGYAKHEQQTLLAVTEARSKALSVLSGSAAQTRERDSDLGELDQADTQLRAALGRLFVVVEQYPALQASTNFITLQDQLEGSENRIAVERQRYNDAVRHYNAKIRAFPGNVVSAMFGFTPRAYFASKLGAEKAVEVKF